MIRFAGLTLAAVLAVSAVPAIAQQRPDPNADVSVANPAFAKGKGPVIAIDSAHRNFQTIAGGYGPFAALLTNDGYQVQDFPDRPTAANLAGIRVLVIAGARFPLTPPGKMPDPLSAFSDDEIQVLHDWVEAGGSLFLCTDHPPYSTAIAALAASFGFTVNPRAAAIKGFPDAEEIFSLRNGGIIPGPLTVGIGQVRTFFGTAFIPPAGATPMVELGSDWSFIAPPATPEPASSADWRIASLKVGKGRVVLTGETGMMSAQLYGKIARGKAIPMGWNAPDATDNRQLVRNIAFWLATGDDPKLVPAN